MAKAKQGETQEQDNRPQVEYGPTSEMDGVFTAMAVLPNGEALTRHGSSGAEAEVLLKKDVEKRMVKLYGAAPAEQAE